MSKTGGHLSRSSQGRKELFSTSVTSFRGVSMQEYAAIPFFFKFSLNHVTHIIVENEDFINFSTFSHNFRILVKEKMLYKKQLDFKMHKAY